MFKAAKFQNVNFGVMALKNDPNTWHIMASGSRTITGDDGKQKTEKAVISNKNLYSTTDDTLDSLFHDACQHDRGPGGPISIGPEAWREEVKMKNIAQAYHQAHPSKDKVNQAK
jgi:hypothetical protein